MESPGLPYFENDVSRGRMHQQKDPGHFRKLTDSMAGAENIKDELGASCDARKQDQVHEPRGACWKNTGLRLEELPKAKAGTAQAP